MFFKLIPDIDYDEINFRTENEARHIFYIAEAKLQGCPRITIKIGGKAVSAILDTGCQLTCMKENLYKKIKQRGKNI